MLNHSPLVSLLIPVYDVELYMEQCARGLFGQTYGNMEYVFVDDCSPDGSIALLEKVLAEFPQRAEQVRIVRHERNRGLAAARNTAMEYASGEWILMQDSDDWLEVDAVERLVAATGEGDDIDMVTCEFYQGPPPCNMQRVVQHRRPTNGVEWLKASLGNNPDVRWMVWNKLLRRSIFDDPRLRWVEGADMAEDFGIMLRLACHIREVSHVDRALVHYVTRPGSFCYEPLSLNKERAYCKNIIEVVAHLHQVGMYNLLRKDITSYLIRHKYSILWRVGLERKECLYMLPRPNGWLLNRNIGVSFRKRLIVYCGIHGWRLPLMALMNISAEWRRLQRQK